MPSIEERIASLLARKEKKQERLTGMKSFRRLQSGISEDEEKLQELQAEKAKKEANDLRREDNAAKILLGAGILLLPKIRMVGAIKIVLAVLKERDQQRLLDWVKRRGLDLEAVVSGQPSEKIAPMESASPSLATENEIGALMHVMADFNSNALSLVQTEFLSAAKDEDRKMLEGLFVKLGKRLRDDTMHDGSTQKAA